MTLDEVLEQTLDLLCHPQFKSFGDLQKHRYQMSKSDDELFLRSDMYKGTKIDPAIVKEAKRKANKKYTKKYKKEIAKKVSRSNKEWHKIPANKVKFKEMIRKREEKRAAKKLAAQSGE